MSMTEVGLDDQKCPLKPVLLKEVWSGPLSSDLNHADIFCDKKEKTHQTHNNKKNQHTKNPTTKFSKENTYITIQMTASMLLVILSLPQTWLLISKTAVASSHISLWSIILSHSTSEVFAVSDNHSLKSTRTCHNLEASSHHRITQGLKFEGTSRGHLVQPPFSSRTT